MICWETALSLTDFETTLQATGWRDGGEVATFCRWFESVKSQPPANRDRINNDSLFLSQILLDAILKFSALVQYQIFLNDSLKERDNLQEKRGKGKRVVTG